MKPSRKALIVSSALSLLGGLMMLQISRSEDLLQPIRAACTFLYFPAYLLLGGLERLLGMAAFMVVVWLAQWLIWFLLFGYVFWVYEIYRPQKGPPDA